VVLFGAVHLPSILPQSDSLHTLLWDAHYYLAFVFLP
jgi:cytochrome b561